MRKKSKGYNQKYGYYGDLFSRKEQDRKTCKECKKPIRWFKPGPNWVEYDGVLNVEHRTVCEETITRHKKAIRLALEKVEKGKPCVTSDLQQPKSEQSGSSISAAN